MPPVQEIAVMLSSTLTLLFVALLMLIGSIVISMRMSTWRTLLMVAGALISLIARTTVTATGYLQIANVVSIPTYQRVSAMTYALGTVGNLVFAAGFLSLAIHIYRRSPSPVKNNSVSL